MDAAPPRFDLGIVLATPVALAAVRGAGLAPLALLARHAAGDWGDICADDRRINWQALRDGSRLFSVYKLVTGESVWAITDAVGDDGRRESTTLLLSSEY